jgi:insulysin
LIFSDTFRYRIIIQSEKNPAFLEEKIEIFLDLLRESITEMPLDEYQSNVSSLVLSLSETPKFLGKETWRYWGHIDSGFYEFKRRKTACPFICLHFMLISF